MQTEREVRYKFLIEIENILSNVNHNSTQEERKQEIKQNLQELCAYLGSCKYNWKKQDSFENTVYTELRKHFLEKIITPFEFKKLACLIQYTNHGFCLAKTKNGYCRRNVYYDSNLRKCWQHDEMDTKFHTEASKILDRYLIPDIASITDSYILVE